MKLAEALLLRADLQKRVAGLRDRIHHVAVVQQGDKPKENAEKLLREAMSLLKDLERLIVQINATNAKRKLADGRTLMEAIAERDRLKTQHLALKGAIDATRRDPDRYGTREIKWVVTLDIAKLQKQADDVAQQLRLANVRIQEANWKVDLDE